MNTYTKLQLHEWANKYENILYFMVDPIIIPRSFMPDKPHGDWSVKETQNVEIMAVIASWLAYGNRDSILKACFAAKKLLGDSPVDNLKDIALRYAHCEDVFYRFYKYSDLSALCERLYFIFEDYVTFDCYLWCRENTPLQSLIYIFQGIKGFPKDESSACKRLNLLLRWMVRTGSKVDIGIWGSVPPDELLIPLDTHAHRIALELGLTKRRQCDMRTTIEITEALKDVFPKDPARGDFALFGYGIHNK